MSQPSRKALDEPSAGPVNTEELAEIESIGCRYTVTAQQRPGLALSIERKYSATIALLRAAAEAAD